MANKLTRYIKVYSLFAKNSVLVDMEYRFSFVFKNFASLLWMVGSLFFINTLFQQTNDIAGWTKQEVTLLYVAFSFASDIFHVFLRGNFEKFSSLTRKGELDWLLLRPINSRFLVSFMTSGVDLYSMFRLVAGVALLFYFMPDGTTWLNVLAFYSFIILGLTAVYSVAYMLHTLNIWFVRLDNMTHLSQMSLELSKVPLDAWPKIVQTIFIYLLPVGVISTFAVQALFGRLNLSMVPISLAIAGGLLFISQKFWNFALRHYSSASS